MPGLRRAPAPAASAAPTASIAVAVPPPAVCSPNEDIWYAPPTNLPKPAYGRRAAKKLVHAGTGAIGLGFGAAGFGLLTLVLTVAAFFVVTVGGLSIVIGILYLANMAAGTL